jgi:N-acylneuraminate cytidylyltransferase
MEDLQIPPVAALIPMKRHSERVPGKNTRPLAGRPLFHWIVQALQESVHVDRIFIDTDSEEIAGYARAQPGISIIDRPDELKGDLVVANELIAHDLTVIPDYRFFLQTHSTNPMLRPATIDRAIETFFSSSSNDSLFSVTALRTRLYHPDGSPINHDPSKLERTQDLPPVFEENSCLYIFSRDSFLRRENRIGERPCLFEIDPEEAWDIDEEVDFLIADLLMRKRQNMI